MDRVNQTITDEIDLYDSDVDSRKAQKLAEVLLVDQPQFIQLAAQIKLSDYTPRPDQMDGPVEKDPDEESDKLKGDDRDYSDS